MCGQFDAPQSWRPFKAQRPGNLRRAAMVPHVGAIPATNPWIEANVCMTLPTCLTNKGFNSLYFFWNRSTIMRPFCWLVPSLSLPRNSCFYTLTLMVTSQWSGNLWHHLTPPGFMVQARANNFKFMNWWLLPPNTQSVMKSMAIIPKQSPNPNGKTM